MSYQSRLHEGLAFARLFSYGSKTLKCLPPLDRLIVDSHTVPRGWGHVRTVGDYFPPGVTFEGDPDGPLLPIPRLYKTIGVMAIELAEIAELGRKHPVRQPSMALRFGNALVIGTMAQGATFDLDSIPAKARVGLGIGRGDVTAQPGYYLPRDDRFVPLESAEALERVPRQAADPLIPIV